MLMGLIASCAGFKSPLLVAQEDTDTNEVASQLTPYEFCCTRMTDPGKPAELFLALIRGVTLSAMFSM